jgi:hypothetical protein
VTYLRKVILSCPKGYRTGLDDLVEEFIRDGVIFVGVVGEECAKVEGIIQLVVGDGSRDYKLITSIHPNASIDEAVAFANSLTGKFAGDVQIVEL